MRKKPKIVSRNSGFVNRRTEFSKSKLAMSLDYIFGRKSSQALNYSKLEFQYSRRTGRLKHVLGAESKNVFFSFRPNGSIAPSIFGFSALLSKHRLYKIKKRPKWTITVMNEVSAIVSGGKTVFCKHVIFCDNKLRAGEDVAVLNEKGELLAVGRSLLSGPTIKQFKRGAAVKVREGKRRVSDEPR